MERNAAESRGPRPAGGRGEGQYREDRRCSCSYLEEHGSDPLLGLRSDKKLGDFCEERPKLLKNATLVVAHGIDGHAMSLRHCFSGEFLFAPGHVLEGSLMSRLIAEAFTKSPEGSHREEAQLIVNDGRFWPRQSKLGRIENIWDVPH